MKFKLNIQFFGRGSSAAGRGGGGSTGGGGTGSNATLPPSPSLTTNATVDDTQQAPPMSSSYDAFMAMTDDEKADAIRNAVAQPVPDHLNNNSDYQRVIYHMGINDKPQVVDDATLDSMHGTTIYRTVDSVYDRPHDISFTAPQIAKQVQSGRITRVSSDGKACYGDGIYFADDRGSSTVYGGTHGNINKTCVMRAKLNGNAKVITYSRARRDCYAEMSSGSKLGKALRNCKTESAISIYALAKGYNVMDAGNGYFNVINRAALTMSGTVTSA